MENIYSRTDLLSRMLDAATLRHQVISNNIANVNTPLYKRMEVTFEDELTKVIGTPGAMKVQPKVVESTDVVERADGNTVDIDREMNSLGKNTLIYQAISQILSAQIGTLRSAITGN
jgi:flagellar basal-body rod protein FlgB